MKNKELTNDGLAKFFANELLKIENYNFDTFYDIAKIVLDLKQNRNSSNSRKKVITNYYFCLRKLGSDLIYINDDNKDTYFERSNHIYEIEICFNSDYFSVPFAKLTKIK